MRVSLEHLLIMKQLHLRPGLKSEFLKFPWRFRSPTAIYDAIRPLHAVGYVSFVTLMNRRYYYLTDDGYTFIESIMEIFNANTTGRRTAAQSNPEPLPVRCEFPAPIPPYGLDAKDPRASAGVYEQEIKGDRS